MVYSSSYSVGVALLVDSLTLLLVVTLLEVQVLIFLLLDPLAPEVLDCVSLPHYLFSALLLGTVCTGPGTVDTPNSLHHHMLGHCLVCKQRYC